MATSITIEISDETAACLRILTGSNPHQGFKDLPAVFAYLASSVADGMRRPGAWEREVVLRLFGAYFEEHLTPDPDAPHRLKPKA